MPALPCDRADALAIVRRLRANGHVAYFAGGCVRDLLLGLTPKDFDVATDAPPKRVRELFTNTQAVGAAFGVILVKHGRSTVEVATFRVDAAYTDGRRPDAVRFTNAEEDAKRRDFTINGLFLDPETDEVIDHVGGRADVRSRVLRAIGKPDERFAEDHLRLLRAVRFAARFDLTLDPTTADAVRAHAPKLARIAPERVADELRRILTAPSRRVGWRLLRELNLTPVVFRHLPDRATGGALPLFDRLDAVEPSVGLAFAAATLELRVPVDAADVRRLVEPTGLQRVTGSIRKAFRVSNEEAADFEGSLDVWPVLQDALPTVALMKRFLARPHADSARALLDAVAACGLHAERIAWLRGRFAELAGTEVAPPPLITGDDLIAAGLSPGRLFKRVLDEVYDAQLEARVATREQARALALVLAADGAPTK
jgi:poly(A) polymerase